MSRQATSIAAEDTYRKRPGNLGPFILRDHTERQATSGSTRGRFLEVGHDFIKGHKVYYTYDATGRPLPKCKEF